MTWVVFMPCGVFPVRVAALHVFQCCLLCLCCLSLLLRNNMCAKRAMLAQGV